MTSSTPPMKSFLQAFNQVGNPMPLADGEGESFALDTIVLKPTLDPEETEWLSNLQRELVHRANLQRANCHAWVRSFPLRCQWLDGNMIYPQAAKSPNSCQRDI